MELGTAISDVVGSNFFAAILALVAVDFATGVLAAVKSKTFTAKDVTRVLSKDVVLAITVVAAQVLAVYRGGTVETVADVGTFSVFTLGVSKSVADNGKELGLDAQGWVSDIVQYIVNAVIKKQPPP